MNIYVGNISYDTNEEDLRLICEPFGKVESVSIIKDKYSGQPKGFGFVEMPSKAEGQAAIDGLNGKELKGRAINMNEARPRTGNFGGGTGGYGGGKGGYGGGSKGGYGGGKGGYGGGSKGGGYSGSKKGGYGGGKGGYSGGRGGRGGRGR
ncbi:MAG: RNA-binding protein [Candidatus Scalindua sp.]|nr:RNA-binding protein [Candidatus Scalindua sp.]